jgi:hypothetical protein
VAFSFTLGGAELMRFEVDQLALPLGCLLFACLVGLRL